MTIPLTSMSQDTPPDDLSQPFAVVTHYRFVPTPLAELATLQGLLRQSAETADLKGTFLLADEGINFTMAGRPEACLQWFNGLPTLSDMGEWQALWAEPTHTEPLWSSAPSVPFNKLVVAIRPEIVTFRDEEARPSLGGEHVSPAEWGALLADPGTITLDVRNDFEVALGSFRNATNPNTNTFTEFKGYVAAHQEELQQAKQVAMFCTGGIRCEKASAYLKQQGVGEVKQLQGGILNYLQHTPPDASDWQGECFVFDGRVTVDHTLTPTGHYRLAGNKVVPSECNKM